MNNTKNAAIAANSTTSDAVEIGGFLPSGIYIPAAMTGTTMTFLASVNGGSWSKVGDGNGGDYTLTFRAGDFVPLDPATFAGVNRLKIVSGATEIAARNLILVATSGQ